MKKTVLITMCLLLLCGCGSKSSNRKTESGGNTEIPVIETKEVSESDFYGTWTVTGVKSDGSRYSVKELEAMGNSELSGVYLVIKQGNGVYLYSSYNDSGSTGTWSYDDETKTVSIAEKQYTLSEDEMILENGDKNIYFEKYSSSQDITDIPKKETEKEEAKEEAKEEVKEEEPVKEEVKEEPVKEETSQNTIRPEIKEAIDSYEAFVDEYCAFMKTYSESENVASLLMQYANMISKMADMDAKMEDLEDDLTDAESLYYSEVLLRCSSKILAAAQ